MTSECIYDDNKNVIELHDMLSTEQKQGLLKGDYFLDILEFDTKEYHEMDINIVDSMGFPDNICTFDINDMDMLDSNQCINVEIDNIDMGCVYPILGIIE